MATTATQGAWQRTLQNKRLETYVSVPGAHLHIIAAPEATDAMLEAFAEVSEWDGVVDNAPPEPLPGQQTFFDELLEEPLARHG
jgi:hypothetical protein